MRTLYLDCGMGAAGDMLTAALLELLPEPERFVAELNALGLPGVEYRAEPAEKCGIRGTHVSVLVHGEAEESSAQHHHHGHHHSDPDGIRHILEHCPGLSPAQREKIGAVYDRIAAAESTVHGVPVTEVHFHEVGALDAVADVTAVCLLMERLAPAQVLVSPIHVGSGTVRCAHGVLPVPAPATAELLKAMPICGGEIEGELCTPTGAALLAEFADGFGALPVMRVQAIGCGMGTKDFARANCLRAFLGETEEPGDTVWELRCNLDDMRGEALGFAMERLFDAGALDVWTTPIGMKKSRPAILLTALCGEDHRDAVTEAMLRHTTTLGVRASACRRETLERRTETVQTAFGPLQRKLSFGHGVRRAKWEYEALAALSLETGKSLPELEAALSEDLNK